MDRDAFEKLVEEAMESLPKKFKDLIRNVAVLVEDYPAESTRRSFGARTRTSILGLYHGVPLRHRGPYYGNTPPDVIIIYQKPIENLCTTDDEIRQQVQDTVIHEVGHYFGFSDAELGAVESREKPQRIRSHPKKESLS